MARDQDRFGSAEGPERGPPGGTLPLFSLAAVIATAGIFGLTYSLTAPLIALEMASQGLDETLIGLNAAMHALGVLLIAPVLPHLSARHGARPLVLLALALTAVLLLLFPAMPSFWLWFPLRLGLGIAAEILFVLSETWSSELATDETRGRVMAVYTAVLSLGFAAGPLILLVTGSAGALPFAAGAAVALAATLAILHPRIRQPARRSTHHGNLLHAMRIAPIAMATTALNAAIETAGLSFIALYALRLGWSEQQGTQLITALMLGAIVLQLPIGWLSDRMDRRRLMFWLAVLSASGAMVWPFLLRHPYLAYPTLFVWGGLFVGIYTTMLALIGSRFRGSALVGVYAAMGLLWGGGALLGPALAGLALDLTPHGLPIFAALACAAFAVLVFRLREDGLDAETREAPFPEAPVREGQP
ncbi:MFS transporter [Roseomonas gilardii subsp. gilardii]|uniref:MFS transporter n=1 Tax=Roseomonas gilardii TaxID=257708 RepID=UPI001FF7BF67|nr:MFS transporter [Roseomonas gilardii]UPG71775.1 MFS transporter [Roseomonas gilardii subsp. gilardii]